MDLRKKNKTNNGLRDIEVPFKPERNFNRL